MKSALVLTFLILLGISAQSTVFGQASFTVTAGGETVTNTEPGRIQLGHLFKMADVVAVVRVVSGDTENYKIALYKAVVLTSFKGTAEGQTLYFGPFDGQRLGWEYIVFLRNQKDMAVPSTTSTSGLAL